MRQRLHVNVLIRDASSNFKSRFRSRSLARTLASKSYQVVGMCIINIINSIIIIIIIVCLYMNI